MRVELELRVAWQRHLGTSEVATEWFDTVLGAYRAEGRHYHGVRHVAWVVRHVESIAADHPVDDLDGTVAAAFFHDGLRTHAPRQRGRERGDGGGAVREIGWTEIMCRHVAEMVMATAGHDVDGVDRDTAVLLAADLAVLAAEPSRYADYATAVRRVRPRRRRRVAGRSFWPCCARCSPGHACSRPSSSSTSGSAGRANLTFWSWLRSPDDGRLSDGDAWRRPRRTLMRIGTG